MTTRLIDQFRQHWKGKGFDPDALGLKGASLADIRTRDGNKAAGNPNEVLAIANTAAVDMAKEVVVPRGLDPEYFRRFKSIYYNHDYDALPVGTLRYAKLDKEAWMVSMAMASHQFAFDVYTTMKDGAINGTSIGFVRMDFGKPTDKELDLYGDTELVTRRSKWLELSITPMPCNPEAEIVGRSMPDLPSETAKAVESLVRKGLIARASAEAMGLRAKRPTVVLI